MTTRVPLTMFGVPGCAANGTTDDTAAFAAALAAGGTLVLEPGKTYLLSTWTAYSNTTPLRIIGNGATIKGPATGTVFLSPAANVAIDGVTFDRWDAVLQRLLAQSGSITSLRFRDNRVVNCTGATINIERPISDYRIVDNTWSSCTGGYAIKIGENTYANQDLYLKGVIRGNLFTSLSASGSASCAAMLVYGREVVIEGNVIDGVQGASGEGWGIYTKTRYAVIRGNTVRNIASTSNNDVVGINVKGSPRSLTSSPQGFSVVVEGNTILNVGVAGTKGGGIRAQTDDVTVANNVIENTGLLGIAADDSNGSQNILIIGNRIIMPGTGDYGIRLDCNGVRIRALHNTIDGPVTGILVAPVAGPLTCSDFETTGNLLNCTVAGYAILFTLNVALAYWRCVDNVVIRAGVGLQNNGGAATWTNVRIDRNDLNRATTKTAGTIPAGVVANNIGYP